MWVVFVVLHQLEDYQWDNLLVRAKRRVAGWVAGGCWDDDIDS